MYNQIEKLASAIKNDVVSGLRGYHTNLAMSIEQLEQDIIDTRLQIIKEYAVKGMLPYKDMYLSINCISIDCESLDRCRCDTTALCGEEEVAHFEIPLLLTDLGKKAIDYIGSTDRLLPFIIYTNLNSYKNHKYRKRGKNKPYVWIDTTPNENGMNDCFVFNAPLLALVSVVGIFKDPRQLSNYECCIDSYDDNMSFINAEIKRRVTAEKLKYYRGAAAPLQPNDLVYTTG